MSTCVQCGNAYEISAKEQELYKKFGFEEAPFCFECDHRNRTCFRNERKLYMRKCDATGQNIVSIYSPDKPYKIYKSDAWYGSNWDAMDYGRDVDFNRPFFEQFRELQLEVPRIAMHNVDGDNSDFCNMTGGNKDCYLVFGGDYNQNVQYGTLCMHNVTSFDLDFTHHSELTYFCGDSGKMYGCQYAFDSSNCSNCYYISDCAGCSECILCTNLNNKSYCINNEQFSKEEYLEKKKELITGNYKDRQKIWEAFKELLKKRIVKYAHIVASENCVGDYISNSKGCFNCYDIEGCEDMTDIVVTTKSKDCFRSDFLGDATEVCYNSQSLIDVKDSKFCYFTYQSSNIEYGDVVLQCHDCFGCVGIDHKRHCILNKQYSESEYKELRGKLIEHMQKTGEWGQFMPKEMSCFGYNETTAYEYFPVSKEEALKQGYKWFEIEESKPEASRTIPAKRLPDDIKDIPDDILNWAIECEASGRLFKITPQELRFYRSQNLPIPHLHSDERHRVRTRIRNPKKLWERKCQKCDKTVQSTYAPERPETVYCEECYLKEVY